jgi:hypothetical protein
MAQGTGLPIPKSGEVVAIPGPISGGDFGAAAWGSIAAAGQRLETAGFTVAETGVSLFTTAEYQRRVGAQAEHENDMHKTRTDMPIQHHNNPEAFQADWPPCRLSPARQKSGFGAKRKWAGRQNQLTRSKMSPHRTFKAVLSFRNISRGERMPMQIRREHDARF